MQKYKQTEIPSVTIMPKVKEAKRGLLPKIAKEYYDRFLHNESVVNLDKRFKIHFSSSGKGKVTRGSALYSKKVALLVILKDILRVAEYSNFGLPKKKRPERINRVSEF